MKLLSLICFGIIVGMLIMPFVMIVSIVTELRKFNKAFERYITTGR